MIFYDLLKLNQCQSVSSALICVNLRLKNDADYYDFLKLNR